MRCWRRSSGLRCGNAALVLSTAVCSSLRPVPLSKSLDLSFSRSPSCAVRPCPQLVAPGSLLFFFAIHNRTAKAAILRCRVSVRAPVCAAHPTPFFTQVYLAFEDAANPGDPQGDRRSRGTLWLYGSAGAPEVAVSPRAYRTCWTTSTFLPRRCLVHKDRVDTAAVPVGSQQ